MATPSKTRGEYRPIYEALFTGKDYLQLSPAAKLALVTLKGLCGAMGIRTWPGLEGALAELTGYAVPIVKKALTELVSTEWIQVEAPVVWIVRGLEFEPQLTPKNADHCKRVRSLASGLPTSGVVARFRDRYALYFADRPPESGAVSGAQSGTGRGGGSHTGSSTGSITASGTPLPNPSPTPSPPLLLPTTTSVPVAADDVRHRTLLVVAANKGITAQWGEQPRPMRWDSPHSHEAVESLASAGVELDFAYRCVFTIASTKKPADGKPPGSLKYFADAVITAWQAELAHRLTAVSPTPALLAVPDEESWDQVIARLERGEGLVHVA